VFTESVSVFCVQCRPLIAKSPAVCILPTNFVCGEREREREREYLYSKMFTLKILCVFYTTPAVTVQNRIVRRFMY